MFQNLVLSETVDGVDGTSGEDDVVEHMRWKTQNSNFEIPSQGLTGLAAGHTLQFLSASYLSDS